jgi:prolyl-tRNA synthetase
MIHTEMEAIGGDCFAFPCLTKRELWDESGRWDEAGDELFRLEGRAGEYCLGPTHEEPVTALASAHLESWKQLPWRFYQLDRKFRDELRPRHGLVRAKEFWMKDMYTFDGDVEAAQHTYELVTQAYNSLFQKLKLPVLRVKADSGLIGGDQSHEYHVAADIGDDALVSCDGCGFAANEEVAGEGTTVCPACASEAPLITHRGIEGAFGRRGVTAARVPVTAAIVAVP